MLLAADTSHACMRVALLNHKGDTVAAILGQGIEASRELESLIASVLNQAQIEVSALTQIVLGSGPGSFTGLRIGYSFFKGLAFALQIPIHTVSTFAAVARAYQEPDCCVAVISDARRDQVFIGAYQFDSRKIFSVKLEPQILDIVALNQTFEQLRAGAKSLRLYTLSKEIELLAGVQSCFVEANFAASLAQIFLLEQSIGAAEVKLGRSELAKELALLSPFYLREVAAKTIAQRQATQLQ